MKIIIEGVDGAGKSTLAKQLAKIFNATIEHDKYPQTANQYVERLNKPGNIVFDRFMLGQFVYNSPEERKMDTAELLDLIDYCKDRSDVILIYLDTSVEECIKRLNSRGDDESFMMKKLGCNSLEELVTTIKKNYQSYVGRFIKLTEKDVFNNVYKY